MYTHTQAYIPTVTCMHTCTHAHAAHSHTDIHTLTHMALGESLLLQNLLLLIFPQPLKLFAQDWPNACPVRHSPRASVMIPIYLKEARE